MVWMRGRAARRRGEEPGGAPPLKSRPMAAARYFDLIREMKNPFNHRLRLIESVRRRGIKATARLFATEPLDRGEWGARRSVCWHRADLWIGRADWLPFAHIEPDREARDNSA